MARPRKEIDVELLKKLASIHCTMEEIASVVGLSVDTLERRYADVIKEQRGLGKLSLRRYQWKLAEKLNLGMLIWLGKQHLGQREAIQDYNIQQLHSDSREKLAEVDSKKLLEIVLKEQKMQGL